MFIFEQNIPKISLYCPFFILDSLVKKIRKNDNSEIKPFLHTKGYFVIQWIKKVLEIGETWKEAGAMVKRVTKEIKSTVETELRKGTSKSRIAHLLGVPYEEGVQIITQIKESIRPEVGNRIRFTFREQEMIGIIWKLLANSAVVVIDWNSSNQCMKDICEARTVVNFKDIVEFLPIEK